MKLRSILHSAAIVVPLAALTSCMHHNDHPATTTRQSMAESQAAIAATAQGKPGVPQSGQEMFTTPQQAAATLKDAVQMKDRGTLAGIFGPDGNALIFSGDRVQENNDLEAFSKHMSEYLHIDQRSDTSAILLIGSENWPFPIPLVKSSNGWFFDTAAGREEILDRRVGEDELNAIAVCHAFVSAEKEYASRDRTGEGPMQYAQHFMSHPGKKDGLYWEAATNEEMSPMGPLIAEARIEGYPASQPTQGKPRAFHGYYFHILTAQGDAAPGGKMSYIVDGKMTRGFALIASPSKYGASGIMTFIVAKDGKVFEKNLGPDTQKLVMAMTEYNPDKSWSQVKD